MRLRSLFSWGLTLLCLLALFWVLPYQELLRAGELLLAVPWYYLLALGLLQVMTPLLLSWQWTQLLRQGSPVERVGWWSVGLRYQAGAVMEAMTPSSKLGGEAARIVLFRQRFACGVEFLSWATLVHKLCMVAALCVAGAILLGFLGWREISDLIHLSPLMLALISSLGILAVILFSMGLRMWWRRRLAEICVSRQMLLGLLLAGVAVWLLFVGKVYFAAWILDISIAPSALLAALVVGYSLGLLPISPGGIGPYEAGMMGMLIAVGLAPAEASALTLLSRLTTFWWPSLLAVLAWLGLQCCSDWQPRPASTIRPLEC